MPFDCVAAFREEAEELLSGIEQSALALRAGDYSADTINGLFRAFHTIKGSGAMCGLDAVAAFTHNVETLLDKVRAGAVPVTPDLITYILDSKDHIQKLLGGAAIEGAPEPQRCWRIQFRPNPKLLAHGGNPILLLRELRELGDCQVACTTAGVPPLDSLQPDLCYLHWTITLHTAKPENAIRDVFIFVEDGAELRIEPDVPEGETAPAAPTAAPVAVTGTAAREATVRVPADRLDALVNWSASS